MSAKPRIVSLVPSLTELLCELGLAPYLVGRTGFCVHPAAALAAIPKVGGTKTVHIERIRRLAPTHCIVNVDENEKPTVEEIARFVPHIIVTHPITVEDNFALYREFGERFDVLAPAQALCDRLGAVLEQIAACHYAPVDVAYLIWNDPWMTVSADTFIAHMLARVGLIAHPFESAARYPAITPELIARSGVSACLLSSEPCRFRPADRQALRTAWQERGLCAPAMLGIDGEMTSWYGPRAITGLAYLARFRARLDARLDQRARFASASGGRGTVRPSSMGLAGLAAGLVLAGLLAGCATTPSAPDGGGVPAASAGTASGPGAAASPRGGRFYLDDGPGERPLSELAKIPDAIPRAEPLHRFANRPYTQFGRHYVPMTRLEPFRERGIATWYGRRYHNRPTSTGERYDMYAMTAAHPTLPLPSYARVTHVKSGRSIIVRINDRGPFVAGRVIDLSYAAAARLGTALSGSAEVEVELITRFDQADAPAGTGGPESLPAPPVVSAASAGSVVLVPPAVATDGAPVAQAVPVSLSRPSATEAGSDRAASVLAESAPLEPTVLSAATSLPSGAVAGGAVNTPASASSASVVVLAPGRYVQLGAYQSRASAQAALERLGAQPGGLPESVAVRQDGALFKLVAGPYSQPVQAQEALRRLRSATGIDAVQLVR